MSKVIITFRDKTFETVSRKFAEDEVLPAYELYATQKIGKLLKFNTKWANVDQIISMNDMPVQHSVKTPSNDDREYLAAISEGRSSDYLKSREKLLQLHKHNTRCLAENRPQDIMYFEYKDYKVIKTSKEKAEKKVEQYTKQQLLNDPRISFVKELEDGELQVKLK